MDGPQYDPVENEREKSIIKKKRYLDLRAEMKITELRDFSHLDWRQGKQYNRTNDSNK